MARKKAQTSSQQQQQIHETTTPPLNSKGIQSSLPHRSWPQFPQVQSELFYECTLFLYSILALFLEYLNLYKTLWWLPKSHWHSSFKFHLINPYVLSCIGLLLGIRVTKCFWDTITKKFNQVNADETSVFWSIMEYAIIKSPLVTMILSSFVFSFSRILHEYELISLVYLAFPLIVYFFTFHGLIRESLQSVYRRWLLRGGDYSTFFSELAYFHIPDGPSIFDSKHVCQVDDRKEFWREAMLLWKEVNYRFWSCVYIGFYTAYFSVVLPTVFVPKKTASGLEQKYLTENHWLHLMFFTVFVTSFFLYALYKFPMELIDRLYQCACHLGTWSEIPPISADETVFTYWDESSRLLHKHNDVVASYYGMFRAERHPHFDKIASSPLNNLHRGIYRLGKDPIAWLRNACIVQAVLIAFQFYALVMATDWQHIFTLVMLMFANYLLLGKFLKDYVIVAYVYSDQRRSTDGAPFPLNGKNLNEKGEYCPQPNDKYEY
ncbi:hypothetical protein M3Y97_00978400 [Aphelenchoides bicaudatus]|nr:hypothetical protein M3Y97_00978400 [Aphelenchoides bicaudatus]